MEYNFSTVKNELLAYRYLRGSWSHGIGIEGKSDYDYGGVWIAPNDLLLGLRNEYVAQVDDGKSDEVYYEVGRWLELLIKSNVTCLESLFVDKKFVVGEIHPLIQLVLDEKDKFLTKDAFSSIKGCAFSQIQKAIGYNKMCHYPENMKRKVAMDFCYTPKAQGVETMKDFLDRNKMLSKYCGLVGLPNNMFGVYYDFGNHIKNESIPFSDKFSEHINDVPLYYRGIFDEENETTQVRLSKVEKDALPICIMSYDEAAFKHHCDSYKKWSEWKKNRNQIRYDSNKEHSFDAKNMCECIRMIHMGIELARDGVSNSSLKI